MQRLVVKAVCSTLLLVALVPCAFSQSDCSQAKSCDLCVGDSMLNLTGCVWRICPDGDGDGTCVIDDQQDTSSNCGWTRVSELCGVVETVVEDDRKVCPKSKSCNTCVGDSALDTTGCVWRVCPDDNGQGMCVLDDAQDTALNCSWTRVSELCTAIEPVAEIQVDGGTSSPKAKFSMSSFIGGIVLVLCLQSGALIAMRFLKSQEKTGYENIEPPQ